MRTHRNAGPLVGLLLAIEAASAFGQAPPPRPREVATPPGPVRLLISVDVGAAVSVNGVEVGRVRPGEVLSASGPLGEQLIVVESLEAPSLSRRLRVTASEPGQRVVEISLAQELVPVLAEVRKRERLDRQRSNAKLGTWSAGERTLLLMEEEDREVVRGLYVYRNDRLRAWWRDLYPRGREIPLECTGTLGSNGHRVEVRSRIVRLISFEPRGLSGAWRLGLGVSQDVPIDRDCGPGSNELLESPRTYVGWNTPVFWPWDEDQDYIGYQIPSSSGEQTNRLYLKTGSTAPIPAWVVDLVGEHCQAAPSLCDFVGRHSN